MKKHFLHFLMTVIALVGMAMPSWADDPDWASMGAGETMAGMGYIGDYYLYNVGANAFLGESVVTADPHSAKVYTMVSTFNDLFELEGESIYYTDGESVKHYLSDEASPFWFTATKSVAIHDQGNNQYRLGTEEDMMSNYLKVDAGSLTLCMYLPSYPAMGCTPDASCNWVFIPKTTFETALASLPSEDPEPEPEGVTDGFYYIQNVTTGKYFTGMTNASGLTDDNAKAALFYISKVEGEDTYKFAYAANRASNGSTTSASYTGININTTTGVGLIVEKSNQAVQQKLTIEGIEGTNNVLIYRNINDINRYLCYDATNNKPNVKDGTSDNNCKWILKPAADFKTSVTSAWTSDTYAQKAVAVSDKQFYYLYNPATGAFMAYSGSSASLNTNPKMAEPFYIIKSGDNYLIKTEKTNGSVVFTSPNWNATSTPLTLTETEVNGKKMYSIVDNSSSTKKSITLCKNRSAGSANSYFNYIQTTLATYPYTADVAATDVLGLWVLIPKSEALNAPDAFDPSDTWAAKGTTEIAEGKQFYLYNPATKTFANNNGLATAASGAYLYTVRPLTGANEGKFELSWPNVNAYSASAAINYVGYNSNTATSAAQFTLERIGETNHYHIYYDLMGMMQYYLTTKRTAISGDVSTYSRFYGANYGESSYVYTPDGFSEWILIPDSEYEQVVTPKPSPEEEDILASGGKNPQNAVAYKMYNVGAKRFLHYETMTDDNSLADDCTVGRDGSSSTVTIQKDRGGSYIGWYLTTGGHNQTAYELTIEEVDGHPGQYYVYKTVGDYDIHLRASWNNAEKYASEAIRSDGDKATLSDKCCWVFLEPKTVYYKAKAEIYAGEGTVKVAFASGDLATADDETDVTSAGSLVENLPVKAYLKATPASGYQFMGWKTDPDGDYLSTDEENFSYNSDGDYHVYAFNVSSEDNTHPDNVTLYAYFEKYDAELYNENGILVKDGDNDGFASIASAITAASKGYTIKLKRNITSAQTINKGVTIDFNGYTISGSTDNLVTVSAPSTDAVTFVDNSIAGNGGVSLEVCTTSVAKAINVTSGTLVINSGHYTAYQCWNKAGTQAYVINRTGGNVRVNGGYFMSYAQDFNSSLWSQRYQKFIFNGSNIKLYGGYFAGNSDELQGFYLFNDTYTLPIVSNNVGLYVGEDMELVNNIVEDPHTDMYIYKVQSAFDEASVVATANGKKFTSLADAIAYANNNADTEMSIRLAKDCSLPAGNYVIPVKATLIVPYNALHTEPLVACPLLNNSRLPSDAYRTLTLENGVRMDVYGTIELGGCAYSYGNGATGTGRPNSDYGHMIMDEGSQIILNNGANLRAWGFVTGAGTIDVRRGARVDEMFQVYDFKGGRGTLAMYENGGHKAFPMNQYFIQNVEVKTTYRPGSKLYTTMSAVNVGISVKIIGVDTDGAALFKMDENDDSEDTWVCKWYDPTTDRQVYDINNSASISNLFLPLSSVIGVQGADFDSQDYILPITNNFKIHVLSGQINITQDVAFLPGAELEINKLCYGKIKANTTTYFYDSEEWGAYVYNGAYASKIKYRPGGLQFNRDITSTGVKDAQMNIHGTLEVDGGFRTTLGGANIFSTNEDAGTVSFTANSLTTYTDETLDTWTGQIYHPATVDNDYKASAEPQYVALAAYPAQLQNAEGFTSTTTEAVGDNAGKSFCYINNEWHKLTDEDCVVTDGENYYIKPQEYIQLSSNTEDANHLYHNVGNTRDFILTSDAKGNCQWWEVEDVAGHPELKHSIHPDNDVYYYYDDGSADAWVEKRFNITWKDWDGTILTFVNTEDQVQDHYELRYGSMPQWFGSTPQREMNAYYTYDFAGWTPALAPVTDDATYTAQFNQTDRKYLITFNDGTSDIETQYLHMGEIPVCVEHPLAENEEWTPAISAVTGDATYTLTGKNVDGPFTITFVNWNGDVLQSFDGEDKIAKDETPVYTGATPVKPSLGDENYSFVGWTPDVVAATANAVYMATFEAAHVTGLNIVDAQTIADTREVSDLRITTTGSLNVTGSVTANNFILESDGSSASGQFVSGYENLHYAHAYFDMKLNAKNHQWYAVAVPWPVNAETGISVNGRALELGKDFDIIYYNGTRRAAEGKQKCWSYVEDDGDKTLVPGRLYMIGLISDAQTVRFEKTTGALSTTTTTVAAHASTTGDETDKGWNGVANPALFHAFVNPGVTEGQVYNPDTKSYSLITLNANKFVVGEGAFVQVDDNKNITVVKDGAFAAPRRTRAQANLIYDVRIAPAEAAYTDRLFIKTTDSRENAYTVGQDLAKVGVSSLVPQMWINRYDAKLCVNTAELINGVAEYPLGISVPANGEYTIHSIQPSEVSDQNDYTVYLTLNGEAIWDLSDAPYTLDLTKGTTNTYGLRISAKAPQVVTGVDEAVVDAKGETKKVLINNQVFIIRGNEVYTIDGQLVK